MLERRTHRRHTASRHDATSIVVWLCTLLLSLVTTVAPAAPSASEYQLKAAYLYHFTQFIEWPESAFKTPDSPFNLCVIGDDPFGDALQPLLSRNHNNHPITIRHPASALAARDCHLLYIAPTGFSHVDGLLTSLATSPVLTISSFPNFVEQGGVIEFVSIDNHVRFSINRTSAALHGLVSSAKLLEVAIQVVDDNHREGER